MRVCVCACGRAYKRVFDCYVHTALTAPSALQNLPADADKLYMYERFAPHGAILSVKVRAMRLLLSQEITLPCGVIS
jgi:hypothetical protein